MAIAGRTSARTSSAAPCSTTSWASPHLPRPSPSTTKFLGPPEGLDLLELFFGHLPRGLPSLDLLRLDVMLDGLDDLRIGKRGDVARPRDVGDADDLPPHDLS